MGTVTGKLYVRMGYTACRPVCKAEQGLGEKADPHQSRLPLLIGSQAIDAPHVLLSTDYHDKHETNRHSLCVSVRQASDALLVLLSTDDQDKHETNGQSVCVSVRAWGAKCQDVCEAKHRTRRDDVHLRYKLVLVSSQCLNALLVLLSALLTICFELSNLGIQLINRALGTRKPLL